MEDEKIDEKVWSVIRYLDPDEREKRKEEATTVTIIATLAILLICSGVWVLFWLRVW